MSSKIEIPEGQKSQLKEAQRAQIESFKAP